MSDPAPSSQPNSGSSLAARSWRAPRLGLRSIAGRASPSSEPSRRDRDEPARALPPPALALPRLRLRLRPDLDPSPSYDSPLSIVARPRLCGLPPPPLRLLPLLSFEFEQCDDDALLGLLSRLPLLPPDLLVGWLPDSLPESAKLFLRGADGKSTCSSAGRPPSPLLNDPLSGTSVTPWPSPSRDPAARDDEAADETLPAPHPRKPSASSSAAASLPEDAAERPSAEPCRTRRDLLVGKSTSMLPGAVYFSPLTCSRLRSYLG